MEITYNEYLELHAGLGALAQQLYSPKLGKLPTIESYVEAAKENKLPQIDIDSLQHLQSTNLKLEQNIPS